MTFRVAKHLSSHYELLYRWNFCQRCVSTWSPLAVAFNTQPREQYLTLFTEGATVSVIVL